MFLRNSFTLQRTFFRRLSEAFEKFLYLTSFFSRFCTPFFAGFAKQQFSMDGFLRDSVKVWLFAFHLTHRGKRFCKVGRQNFFKFSLAPYNTVDGRIVKRSEKKTCGGSRSAGFGEGTPQQDHHKGENEQSAKFGTVVESCSNNFRYHLNGDFCKPFTLQRTKSRTYVALILKLSSLSNGNFRGVCPPILKFP